jgi:4-phytase / acid phosphatase
MGAVMKIKMLSLILSLVITLSVGAGAALAQDYAPQGELVRLVMLSRHGVRPPLQDPDELNKWRQPRERKWPALAEWFRRDAPPRGGAPICRDSLTNHGAKLMQLMGAYYRDYLDKEKLLTPNLCPKDDVFIWTDLDERTRATAEALVVGLAPQCSSVAIKGDPNPEKKDPRCKKPEQGPDPLFHPTTTTDEKLQECLLDPNRMPILDDHTEVLKRQVPRAQAVLECCSTALCERENPPPRTCVLPELRSWFEPNPNESSTPQHVAASVKGGLNIAQSFAEILMLQYAQGFGDQEFGFGLPEPNRKPMMLELLQIHTEVFKQLQRAHHVAQQQGDNLLYHLSYAVEHGTDPSEPNGKKKLIAYIGHDTNIANVAGILNLHWHLSEYPDDDMPPGGALIFEVRKDGGQLFVSAAFAVEPPDIMRDPDKLLGPQPIKDWWKIAKMAPVSILCTGRRRDGSCPIAEFTSLTAAAGGNKVCVTDPR